MPLWLAVVLLLLSLLRLPAVKVLLLLNRLSST